MSQQLLAGTAEVDITPPPGCAMIHRRATAVHDPLYARALVLELDGRRAAIVGLDLIGLGPQQVARVRRQVRSLCGIEPSGLLLCCSHTHSGPVTRRLRGWGEPSPGYIAEMIERTGACVASAARRAAPAELGYGEAPLQVGCNRRLDDAAGTAQMAPNAAGPVDRRVKVLRVAEPGSGAVRAVLFSHGCHAVVLHRSSSLLSADYPGRAAAFLKDRLGQQVCAIFAQGCGGDANTEVLDGAVEDMDRIGIRAGEAALQAIERAEPIAARRMATALTTVRLPTRTPTRKEAQQARRLNESHLRRLIDEGAPPDQVAEFQAWGVEWAEDLARMAERPQDYAVEMDVAALAIDPRLCVVGLGAEAFHGYERLCAADFPWPVTMALADVNAACGYLPTAGEFARGGYETAGKDYVNEFPYAYKRYGTAALTPECEAAVRHALSRTVTRLWRSFRPGD